MVEESHVRKIKQDTYYVASSDGLGLIITTVQLKENDKDNNYAEWAKAMRLALQEQHQNLARMDEHGSDGVAFAAVKPVPAPSLSTNSRQICTHCRCHAHISSSCFFLVGFPNWWPKNSTTARNEESSLIVAPEQETMATAELSLLEKREDTAGVKVGLLMAERLSEVSCDRDRSHCQKNVKKMVGSMLCRSGGKECL
ncbi:hypothetical protein M9H77_27894 [Catharanthus roseus]|uniref:Uncharacterized protein n=1 Tax=Catharanthus roseus TaxID=4058 RepID=A0ACC0AHY3_CATRO|nr:hypothetical protein M9H77_27894 [Catharanthus roseus]